MCDDAIYNQEYVRRRKKIKREEEEEAAYLKINISVKDVNAAFTNEVKDVGVFTVRVIGGLCILLANCPFCL